MSVGLERLPGTGKYARTEVERRWLISAIPDGAVEERRIEDRYLAGTTLRLRRVEDESTVVYKLGQKVRPLPDDPHVVHITNLYLTAFEYQLLVALPAAVLVKTRRLLHCSDAVFAVDEFGGALSGLLLAETED